MGWASVIHGDKRLTVDSWMAGHTRDHTRLKVGPWASTHQSHTHGQTLTVDPWALGQQIHDQTLKVDPWALGQQIHGQTLTVGPWGQGRHTHGRTGWRAWAWAWSRQTQTPWAADPAASHGGACPA